MKKTIYLLIPTLLLFGCMKDEVSLDRINTDTFNPSFAIPVANARLQVGRINDRGNRLLEVNPTTGLLELSYVNESFTLGFSDIYQVTSQILNESVLMPGSTVTSFNASAAGTSTTFSLSNTATITVPSSEQLDSVIVQNGNLTITISSSFPHNTSIILTIPSLIKNGIAYSKVIPLSYTGTVPVTVNINDPIDGYSIDFTDVGITDNTIRFNYSVDMIKGVTPVTGAESVDFNFNFDLNTLESAYGYFGNTIKTTGDTARFDLFDNLFGGTLSFADPRIELHFINSTGIDIDANVTSITAPENTTNQNLGGPGLTNIPRITKASMVGDSSITNHIIDNSNTAPNLSILLDEKPSKFAFSASLQFNPSGFSKNYITQNSEVKVTTKLVLPLDLYGQDFSLTDTNNSKVEDVFGIDLEDADNINKITLRLFVTNHLPLESDLQVYFADTINKVIDSLFENGTQMILRRAVVDFSGSTSDSNYGKVTSATTNTIDIEMTKEKYKRLIQANSSKIIFKTTVNSVDASSLKYVKIFPEDFIDIKLSAKLDLNIVIN